MGKVIRGEFPARKISKEKMVRILSVFLEEYEALRDKERREDIWCELTHAADIFRSISYRWYFWKALFSMEVPWIGGTLKLVVLADKVRPLRFKIVSESRLRREFFHLNKEDTLPQRRCRTAVSLYGDVTEY